MCDDKMNSCGNGGGCGQGRGCNHKHLMFWLLAIVIGMIVFCAGYKLGVMRGYFGGYPAMYNQGWGMMRGWQGVVSSESAVTTSVK